MFKKQPAKKKKVIGFDDLNDKLDLVISNMATKDDVARLDDRIDHVIANMATKEELQAMDEKSTKKFHENLIATEGLMKPISDLNMNYAGTAIQLSRHEEWIRLIAQKTGVALPL